MLIRVFSWPKKIMPPRHQDTKVHKDFYSCVVETFLLKFGISKNNINHLSCHFVCFRGKKIMPPSHKGSQRILIVFLRVNSCAFVAKKNNATKSRRHKGSQRFLIVFLRVNSCVFVAKKRLQ